MLEMYLAEYGEWCGHKVVEGETRVSPIDYYVARLVRGEEVDLVEMEEMFEFFYSEETAKEEVSKLLKEWPGKIW